MEKTQAIQLNIEGEKQDYKTDTNDFKTQHIATVIKLVQYQQRKRQIDQWNRIENLGKDSHKYAQQILTKGQKQFSEGETAFSTNGIGASGYPLVKNMNLDLNLTFTQNQRSLT